MPVEYRRGGKFIGHTAGLCRRNIVVEETLSVTPPGLCRRNIVSDGKFLGHSAGSSGGTLNSGEIIRGRVGPE